MKKRILSLLLALALIFPLLAGGVTEIHAADLTGECGDNLTWSFDAATGTLMITGSGDMYDWGYGDVAPWQDYAGQIRAVDLPAGLTRIGNNAFCGCVNLKEAAIPQGVVTLGVCAFSDCASLKTISIPGSVTSIGTSAFSACTALTAVDISEGVTNMDGAAFAGCTSLTHVSLPDSLTVIGPEDFSRCSALRNVTLPPHLKSVMQQAFSDCESLTEITLPDGLETIEPFAFSGCTGLRRITIPGSVCTIWNGAFSGCSGLTSVTIRDGVTEIMNSAFMGCDKLAWAYIPASVQSLEILSIGVTYDATADQDVALPGFKIYGFTGTSAESYAKDNGIPFCPIDPASGFGDVSTEAYYYEPMLWALENGITTGTSEFTFGPGKGCTRGQVVTFLWRANGCPEPTMTENPFTDVSPEAYYYKAVLWAVEQKITMGTTKTTFKPNGICTRAQVVAFLGRAFAIQNYGDVTLPFTDVPEQAYYHLALLWAYDKGIVTGITATTFGPNRTCTRGQVVTFLYRAYAQQ